VIYVAVEHDTRFAGRPWVLLDPFTEDPIIIRRKVWSGRPCIVTGPAWRIILLMKGH